MLNCHPKNTEHKKRILSLGLLLFALQLPVVAQSLSPEAQTQTVNRQNEWLISVQNRIGRNWFAPQLTAELVRDDFYQNRTILLLIIDRKGNLKGSYLKKASRSEDADKAAFKAVQRALPLPSFPDEMSDEEISLSFDFTINFPGHSQKAERLQAQVNEQRTRLNSLSCARKPSEQVLDAIDTYDRFPSTEIGEMLVNALLKAEYWKILDDTLPRLLTRFPTRELKLKAMLAAYRQGNLSEAQKMMNEVEKLLENLKESEREAGFYEVGNEYFLHQGYILYELNKKEEALAAWEIGKKYARSQQREGLRLMGELVKQEGKVSALWRQEWAAYGARILKNCPNANSANAGLQGNLEQLFRQALRP